MIKTQLDACYVLVWEICELDPDYPISESWYKDV